MICICCISGSMFGISWVCSSVVFFICLFWVCVWFFLSMVERLVRVCMVMGMEVWYIDSVMGVVLWLWGRRCCLL